MLYIICDRIKQIYGIVRVLWWRRNYSFTSKRVDSCKYSYNINMFPPIAVWSGVFIISRITGINSKISSFSIGYSCREKDKTLLKNVKLSQCTEPYPNLKIK